MMIPGNYDLADQTLEQLADLRAWQLARVEKVTAELRSRVRDQYREGVKLSTLAKKAGVTRRTVYAWLSE
jgi:DNA invertase Pin-like site-specific DNA recombinase